VGSAYIDANYWHAFLYKDGVMTDLGVLTGHVWSKAEAINDSGVIVGTVTFEIATSAVTVWTDVQITISANGADRGATLLIAP
jgi:probable HAF family extracellular repeat protein